MTPEVNNNDSNEEPVKHKRRVRYKGSHPRQFNEKYKELNSEKYPEDIKIMPGHGPLSNMDDLVEYHTMLVETTQIVQKQMNAGTTLDEIQTLGLPERWQKWEGALIDESTWIQIVHTSLSLN